MAAASVIEEVRAALGENDFALAESCVREYRSKYGTTSEIVEALASLGSGALHARRLANATMYAEEVYRLAPETPALGAAIEVLALVMDARGERGKALHFLEHELLKHRNTPIHPRIARNIHLLSLEGKPAPTLEINEWVGREPPALADLKGYHVLLFCWAHYCEDSRAQAPVLARLLTAFREEGLVLIGPTRRYGYVNEEPNGELSPAAELGLIENALVRHYSDLAGMPVPIGTRNFRTYGVSTTPTLILIDTRGIVRLYHPGKMSYPDLLSHLRKAT